MELQKNLRELADVLDMLKDLDERRAKLDAERRALKAAIERGFTPTTEGDKILALVERNLQATLTPTEIRACVRTESDAREVPESEPQAPLSAMGEPAMPASQTWSDAQDRLPAPFCPLPEATPAAPVLVHDTEAAARTDRFFAELLAPKLQPSRAEPSRAEPSRAEPSRAEPSRAEPTRTR